MYSNWTAAAEHVFVLVCEEFMELNFGFWPVAWWADLAASSTAFLLMSPDYDAPVQFEKILATKIHIPAKIHFQNLEKNKQTQRALILQVKPFLWLLQVHT